MLLSVDQFWFVSVYTVMPVFRPHSDNVLCVEKGNFLFDKILIFICIISNTNYVHSEKCLTIFFTVCISRDFTKRNILT